MLRFDLSLRALVCDDSSVMPRAERQRGPMPARMLSRTLIDQVMHINRNIQVTLHRAANAADILKPDEPSLDAG